MAEIDSCASDNFVQYSLLTADERRTIKPGPSSALLAGRGTSLRLKGIIYLSPRIGDREYPGYFHASDELRAELTLGRTWLKQHDVHHEHRTDCLYLGASDRQRIYLVPMPDLQSTPKDQLELELPSTIPPEFEERLWTTLETYASVFHQGGRLRQTLAVEHDIQILDPHPFREPPRRQSMPKRKYIDEQLREMLADGIIEPTTSPWSSAITIATKQNGEHRFCIDFRRLNDQTVNAPQCLPRIHEILKDLGKAKVFTTLDLKSGYWQIPMAADAKKYTAFSAPSGGQYQFRVMPFGLKNAPGTFQNLMRHVLAGHWGEFCMAYLDDIIVYSGDWDSHIRHVGLILERLHTYGLTCSPQKCHFGRTDLEFLGHVVTTDGNHAQPRHVEAILNAEPPKNRKQLQSFIGTCNWLMEYIPKYSELAAPLTTLASPTVVFKWTPEINHAFQVLKEAFRNPSQLSRPDPDLPFVLQTDASAVGMGAVLMQIGPNGNRRIISYASAKFSKTETRYHCNEQECLAVIWAIKKYRPYLEDQPFILRTDSKTLTWLRQMKDSRAKLNRWHIFLSELSFTIEHCPGKDNELPDALSRQPDPGEPSSVEPDLERMVPPRREAPTAPVDSTIPVLNAIQAQTLTEEISAAQRIDPEISSMILRWSEIRQHGPANQRDEEFVENNMYDERGLWKRSPEDQHWQLRVPITLRQRVIWDYHDVPLAGHPGAEETTRAIQEHFFWPGMSREIKRYVARCHLCICTKPLHGRHTDGQRPRTTRTAWETLAVDLMGPYPLTKRGNRFILVVTDMFTRWVESFPLRNSHAPTLIRTLEDEVFCRFGYPRHLLSDNGSQFTSTTWTESAQRWECALWTTPEYHPRANPTERRNQEVKKGLRLRLTAGNQRIWDEQLPELLFGLRRRRNAATGYTPSYLLMGREILRPGEWALQPVDTVEPVRVPLEERENRARRNQQQYQLRYAGTPAAPAFKIGDWVYAANHRLSNKAERYNAGLAPKRTGPHQVIGVASADVFWVQKYDRPHKLHKTQLVLAPQPREVPAAPRQGDDEAPGGVRQEDAEIEDVAREEDIDFTVAEKAQEQEAAEETHRASEAGDIAHAAEQARLAEHGSTPDVGSTGAAAQAHPRIKSHLPVHEATTPSLEAEHLQLPLVTNTLPKMDTSPTDVSAETQNPEPWDQLDELPRNARGRYDLRMRRPATYRDARPYAPRMRRH